jgi:hypothetical protein
MAWQVRGWQNAGVPGIEEVGLIVVVWAAGALIFREWLLRFDVALLRTITGTVLTDDHLELQRKMLEQTGRLLLVCGLVVFFGGLALRLTGNG